MKAPVNPNYCASVVEITKLVAIDNADNLQAAIIYGSSVIVGKNINYNTAGLFFPLECQLGDQFLYHHSLYRDKTKNLDPTHAGFFEQNGRVRAVKLRGQKSEGFFIPLADLHESYNELKELAIGTDFDYLNDERICRKYIVKEVQARKNKTGRQGSTPKFTRLIPDQFHLHVDSIQAKKYFDFIKPDDLIYITDKFHGTSAVFANVLTNRTLSWYEKLLLKLGVNINTSEYGNIYSSRKVVKNQYINAEVTGGFYKTDVWGHINNEIKDLIPEGVSIYGEIVGYLPGDNKEIQPGYTYGCQVNTCEFLVYRITNTNTAGLVTEYSWQQIKDFCKKYGLKHVVEFYYGFAKDLYPDISTDNHWHENVLSRLQTDFNLEKKCKYNPTKAAEGIVIRQEKLFDCVPLKLKAFAFMEWETKQLDSGTADIESDESSTEETTEELA
jgi:hypothetical protein